MSDSNQHNADLVGWIEDALALLNEYEPDFSSEIPHVMADLRGLEEQVQTYERALIRIRDWDGFRHTGEVRDCAGEALRG